MHATEQAAQRAIAAAGAWVEPAGLEPLGNGHIHQTYLLSDKNNAAQRYVLQRINPSVYQNIPLLMQQTQTVLATLTADAEYCSAYQVAPLVAAKDGQLLHTQNDDDGVHCWRLWHFVEGSITCDPPSQRTQIWQAARAFGAYQRALAVLSPAALQPTISGFLHMPSYLDQYDKALADCSPAVRQEVSQWLSVVEAQRHWPEFLNSPNAMIHGDCKINNVLFDAAGESAIAVIDLDNNMYGHWAWDFGDLVRSVAFSRGGVDTADYRACASGFVAGRGAFAVQGELYAVAPAYLAFILGLRFVTDHMNGDRYFSVPNRGDNLRRAAEQFELLRQFQLHAQAFTEVAEELVAEVSAKRS